jgi:hypothetical protein
MDGKEHVVRALAAGTSGLRGFGTRRARSRWRRLQLMYRTLVILALLAGGCAFTRDRGLSTDRARHTTTPPIAQHREQLPEVRPHAPPWDGRQLMPGPIRDSPRIRLFTGYHPNPYRRLWIAAAAGLALFLLAIAAILWRSRSRRSPPRARLSIPCGLPVTAHDGDLNCAYCRSRLAGRIVSCAACATPYHADCARNLTACAIYACGSLAFRSGARPAFVPTAAITLR